MKFDIKKMSSEDRTKMILQDVGSLIDSYNMGVGEAISIFLMFAVRQSRIGALGMSDFIGFAADAWNDEILKEENNQKCDIINIPNNGLFKS